jgi:hypothetical protein
MLLITMPLLSSIPTDIGSRRITVRAKGDGGIEALGELSEGAAIGAPSGY